MHPVQTGMRQTWKEGMAIYESNSNLVFIQEFEQTLANLIQVQQGESLQEHLGSSVDMLKQYGEYSYVDLLFLSEGQVLKYCGASTKALGLTLEERDAEDGSGVIKGV